MNVAVEAPYSVEVDDRAGDWRVRIVDRDGRVASERACRDGAEARTYASTVRQHLYWLSADAFRAYYRIED